VLADDDPGLWTLNSQKKKELWTLCLFCDFFRFVCSAMMEFFIFFFDFRKIMDQPKISRNIHLPPNPTAAGVLSAVGHDSRGAANGRLTC
jgi:hypothetical protein